MKKLLLLVVCTVLSMGVYAQASDEAPAQKPSHKGFVTNGFWDNWEISLGVGAATENIGNDFGSFDHGSFWHRIGWEANVSATKWLHPVWGLRLQLQGGQFKDWRSADAVDPERTPFIFLHTDLMINLSNWIGGYREDRVYYAVPFIGFGYQALDFTDSAKSHGYGKNDEYAFTAGLLNKFRVCECIDINLELKWWYYPENDHAIARGGKTISAWSATAGFTYRFNKRNWERKPVCNNADAVAYAALIAEKDAALAAAQEEIAALQQPAPAPAEPENEVVTNTVYLGEKMVIFFEIGEAELNDFEKVRLGMKAEQIKNGPTDKVYHVEGHADPQTGNSTINQTLSDQRAKAVYDYLVAAGVNPEQLTYEGSGDRVEPFGTMETNRVVIIY
uniref:OmpA family protein n=1 Tax=Alistipes sp. TaxID=1872444 RepID=UPI0040571B78